VSTVLIVDDNADQAWLAGHILRRDGHECTVAHDADIAWKSLLAETPDVILLDLHLGIQDGWALLERMRADPRFHALPVVVMTASREAAIVERAHGLSAEYLDKSLIASSLPERVRDAIARVASVRPISES
jgi:chemosensory pili system protein ChpA (sensor histidine kinase/response regulator)